MNIADLPALNATLNAAATVLLLSGWASIKMNKKSAHICFMILALLVSAAFLTFYLIYHFNAGHVPFHGTGFIKIFYLVMLFTHVVLAIANLPLIILTVIPAVQHRFDKHKRLARWTFPVWLYVSVTGVLVYLFCYVWFP
jgi:uncharacterized membrane protein YozB (DUF420 family)